MKIDFSPPDITQTEIDAVVDALKSGWITTGTRTREFEAALADFCGTERVVCLSSATAALAQVLRLLGIGPGDEVITSAYTYTASASVIHHVGATIVLVDTAPDSFFMDHEALKKAINPRTKAIIAVDLAGIMCDYPALFQLADEKKDIFCPSSPLQEKMGRIAVIADGAHSLGAEADGFHSGQAGDFTVFSFHAVKNLTTAEGGAVTWKTREDTDSDDMYKELMLLSLHGQTKDALAKAEAGNWEYDIVTLGYKCNMTDVLAALGMAQLDRYRAILKSREDLIRRYDAAFAGTRVKPLSHYTDRYRSTGHLYMVRIDGLDEAARNQLIKDLAGKDIPANVHYKPLPLLTAYRNLGFLPEDFPHAMAMYASEVTLPLHSQMTLEEVDYVAQEVLALLGESTGMNRE